VAAKTHDMIEIAVIFDMDGVILDSEQVYQEIEREMYAELGIKVTREEHMSFMGTTENIMWEHMKTRHGLTEDPRELARRERERLLSRLRSPEGIPPMEGIEDLLQELHEKGIPLLLASSSVREIIETVLRKLNIGQYFSGIVSGDEVEYSKPAPDIFLEASRIAGIPPSKCVVIEDSENGIRAARSAGMKAIGLRNPHSGDVDLSGADRIVHSLKEINADFLV
jgi:HAD superfamily hydrolase (TIGR01509 family)